MSLEDTRDEKIIFSHYITGKRLVHQRRNFLFPLPCWPSYVSWSLVTSKEKLEGFVFHCLFKFMKKCSRQHTGLKLRRTILEKPKREYITNCSIYANDNPIYKLSYNQLSVTGCTNVLKNTLFLTSRVLTKSQ